MSSSGTRALTLERLSTLARRTVVGSYPEKEKRVEMGVCCSELSRATWELGHTQLLGAEMQGSVWPHQELLRPGGIGKNGAKIKRGC